MRPPLARSAGPRPPSLPSWLLRLAVLAALLPCPVAAPAVEHLVWAGSPYAPMVIREGALAQRGYVDRMIDEVLRPGLPQYTHEVLDTSPLRLERELTGLERAVCSPAFSRNARRELRYAFTGAIFRFLPAGIVMQRDDPRLPAAPGPGSERPPLMLDELFAQKLRLGLVGFRAYGGEVDVALTTHARRVQRFILGTSNQSILAMLARGHAIDAALVYEFELTWFAAQNPELGRSLVWWPLKELQETQLSYIACSANPAGRSAVAAIDALLARPGTRERLQSLYEEWLDAPSRQQLQAVRRQMGARYWQD